MRTGQRWIPASTLSLTLVGALSLCAQQTTPASEQSPGGWRKFGDPAAAEQPLPAAGALTLPAGTWITVRMNEGVSSDRNQPGDAFTATLTKPLVANGLVVATQGQTVGGHVVEAQQAGRVKGTSRLGL